MDHARRNLLIGGSILSACVVGGLQPSACAMRQITRKPAKTMNGTPKRPEGEAKPMLQEDIAPVLARLDTWYAANLAPDRYVFNPPATDAQLDAFEQLIGLKMPRSYRQLYRWHDGENDDRWGHVYGLPILPLKRAARDWKQWKRTLAEFGGNPYPFPQEAWPEGVPVQPVALLYDEPEAIAWVGTEPGLHNAAKILARTRPVRLTVRFLDPLTGPALADRKTMAAAAREAIAVAL